MPEPTRITIDLPEPEHVITARGFKHLEGQQWDAYERSHAERAMVEVADETMTVADAEKWGLAVLWLVRNHYHGEGLTCEVTDVG